ncbi:hypothetical protein NPX13_g2276 [Xylaria arbuscula]|uniref:Uncharacterized protein n=1 Tax=Xylaria arbuscula TaxID=114810 RepID=A0A9W8NKQ5_9PEZI|nr:hypothetical protein NPX13_g2276 [Xylaria arbuscula]
MGHTSPREIPYSDTEDWLSQKGFQEGYGVDFSTDVSEYLQEKETQTVEDWQSPVPAITAPRNLPMGSAMGTDITRSPTASRGAAQGHTGMPSEVALLCFCYSYAIATFDNIQTKLVWKPHKKISELLQCQKQSLSECENLLTCKSCTSQSKYITLIIVMCEDLLASMEGGCRIQSWCRQWDGVELSEPWNEIEKNDDRQQGERRDKVVGEETSVRPGEDSNKVVIGRWQLDSDDQLSVIQGLISTRVVRLSNLVTKLGGIANEHQWPDQGRRIQDVRERCHSISRQLRDHAEG